MHCLIKCALTQFYSDLLSHNVIIPLLSDVFRNRIKFKYEYTAWFLRHFHKKCKQVLLLLVCFPKKQLYAFEISQALSAEKNVTCDDRLWADVHILKTTNGEKVGDLTQQNTNLLFDSLPAM